MSTEKKSSCHYLPYHAKYYPVEEAENAVPQCARHLYLPMVYDTDFLPNAQTFGHINAKSEWARLIHQARELIGDLCKDVDLYRDRSNAYGAQIGGKLFPRATAFFVRFKNAQGRELGLVMKITFCESPTEDLDLEEYEEGPKKTAEKHKRLRGRNPDHMLEYRLTKPLTADEKKLNLPWYYGIGVDKYITDFAMRLHAVYGVDDARYGSITRAGNPANLFQIFSLRWSLSVIKAAGASGAYLNPLDYEYHRFPGTEDDTIRVPPNILEPATFGSYLLPHFPRPRIDLAEPENARQVALVYEDLLSQAGGQFLGRPEEEKKDLRRRLKLEADGIVRTRVASKQTADNTTGSLEQLKAAVSKIMKKAMDDAHKLRHGESEEKNDRYTRKAAARTQAQKEALILYRIFMQQDDALNRAAVSIREWGSEYLANHPKHNFCLPRPAMFQNLSLFGEMAVLQLIEEETVLETNVLHAVSYLFRHALMHVYFEADLHPNPVMVGRAMGGKSHMFKTFVKQLIPGTAMFLQGSSEKATLTKDTFQMGDMIMLEEELMPSTLGIENSSKKHNATFDNPNTDKASRFRASATSREVGYSRLEKNSITGKFELEVIDKLLNRIFGGAANFALHQLPENVRSRVLAILVAPKTREGQSLLDRVMNGAPEQYQHVRKQMDAQIRVNQYLMYHVAKMMYVGIIEMNQKDSDEFAGEVFQLANRKCITGMAQDIREWTRIRSICQVHATQEAIHRVFHAENSPLRDQPFDLEQIITHVEPVLRTSVEHAAHVLEQMADQFSPPFAADILRAINASFPQSPFHKAKTSAGDGGDDSDVDDIEEEDKAPSAAPSSTTSSAMIQSTMDKHLEFKDISAAYVEIDVADKVAIGAAYLYRKIEGKMLNRPPQDTGEHYLTSLTSTEVPIGNGKTIPALVFDDINKKIRVAKELLRNPAQNQFRNVVLQVLCLPHMPQQVFVRGSAPHDTPWKWRLFANDEKLLADPSDRKELARLRRLQRRATKEAPNARIIYNPAHQEEVMWNVVRGIPSHLSAEEGLKYFEDQMARKSFVRYLNIHRGVRILDMDREDSHAMEFLSERVFFDPERASQSIWGEGYRAFPRFQQEQRQAALNTAVEKFLAPVERKINLLAPNSSEHKRALRTLQELRNRWQYPLCFESRNPKEYKKRAIQAALDNPAQSSVSARCKSWNDIAQLGYIFAEGKDEKNRPSSSERKRNTSSSMQEDGLVPVLPSAASEEPRHNDEYKDMFGEEEPGLDEMGAAVEAEWAAQEAEKQHTAAAMDTMVNDEAFPVQNATDAMEETKAMLQTISSQQPQSPSRKRPREEEEEATDAAREPILPMFDLYAQLLAPSAQQPEKKKKKSKKKKSAADAPAAKKQKTENKALENELKGLDAPPPVPSKRERKPRPGTTNHDGLGPSSSSNGLGVLASSAANAEDEVDDDDYDPTQAAEEAELDDELSDSKEEDTTEDDGGEGDSDEEVIAMEDMGEGYDSEAERERAGIDQVDPDVESGEATEEQAAREEKESEEAAAEEEAAEERERIAAARDAGFADADAAEAAEDMDDDTKKVQEDAMEDDSSRDSA